MEDVIHIRRQREAMQQSRLYKVRNHHYSTIYIIRCPYFYAQVQSPPEQALCLNQKTIRSRGHCLCSLLTVVCSMALSVGFVQRKLAFGASEIAYIYHHDIEPNFPMPFQEMNALMLCLNESALGRRSPRFGDGWSDYEGSCSYRFVRYLHHKHINHFRKFRISGLIEGDSET